MRRKCLVTTHNREKRAHETEKAFLLQIDSVVVEGYIEPIGIIEYLDGVLDYVSIGRIKLEDWEDEYPECQKLEVQNE